ncbi:capsid maturation protease [Murid herpesvirus 3]|uniref:Capsid scaffolding protein n=2 Tax=Murid betaherpesvirus 3 TaxID=2560603 RepID=A0A1P8VIX4_9BETA|nr:capsid maturation protease [Murine roseolovirus]APZ76282.1 capsid maturation protease [Murid betaherpesvirus 3]AYH64728.1 capsid maturation protease [Murid herpesvirus 3]
MDPSTIYVGGFVYVYGKDRDELYIPKDVIHKFIASGDAVSIPLNINHNDLATIGYILNLFDLKNGLFCIGKIDSSKFITIMSDISKKSQLIALGPNNSLRPNPLLECLSAFFPAFSLSSKNLNNIDDINFFKHVSICGIGKRCGTVCVYGETIRWIVDKFNIIDESEKDRVLNVKDSGRKYDFNFDINLYDLLANTLDTSYIKDRLSKLRLDKKISGLSDTTYIKASKVLDFDNSMSESEIDKKEHETNEETTCIDKDKSAGVDNTIKSTEKLTVEPLPILENTSKVDILIDIPKKTETNTSISTSTVNTGLKEMSQTPINSNQPGLLNDGIYIPKDMFMSLLNMNNNYPNSHIAYNKPQIMDNYYGSQGMEFINRPMNGYVPSRYGNPYIDQNMHYGVPEYNRYDRHDYKYYQKMKRRYESDSDDDMAFPGDPDYIRKKQKRYDPTSSKSINREILDTLGSIKREIGNLRSTREHDIQNTAQLMETENVDSSSKPHASKPIINASMTPTDSLSQNKNMLNINKKLFVNAMKKLDI